MSFVGDSYISVCLQLYLSEVSVIKIKPNLATGKSQKVLKVVLYSNIEIDKC